MNKLIFLTLVIFLSNSNYAFAYDPGTVSNFKSNLRSSTFDYLFL